MTEHKNMTEHQERQAHRVGNSPGYRAFHEVYVTKGFGSERNEDLVAFINQHINEFKGKTEDKHGIPQMLFEREQDAQEFANELQAKLNIPKEHITLKARKYTR
jgi:hypothetical protein